MDSLRVCFRSSTYIEQSLERHPLQWLDRELAVRGGPEDKAGATPTPAVQEFLNLANRRPGLFSYEQYITHCIQKWHAWYSILAPLQRRGVVAKLKNNFYPAMIDTLHAQAIMIEARVFDYVLLDLQSDVEDKVDLVLRKRGRTLRVALVGPENAPERIGRLSSTIGPVNMIHRLSQLQCRGTAPRVWETNDGSRRRIFDPSSQAICIT